MFWCIHSEEYFKAVFSSSSTEIILETKASCIRRLRKVPDSLRMNLNGHFWLK